MISAPKSVVCPTQNALIKKTFVRNFLQVIFMAHVHFFVTANKKPINERQRKRSPWLSKLMLIVFRVEDDDQTYISPYFPL